MVEVYAEMERRVNALATEVRANKDEQAAVNLNQAVLNGTTNATIACIQG